MYKLIMRWARFSSANAPTSSFPTPAHRTKRTTLRVATSPTFHRNSSNFHPISLTFRPEYLIHIV